MKKSRKIRILFTIPNFKTAGSQYVVLSLFKRINRELFDPYICVENFPEFFPAEIPEDKRLLFKWKGNAVKDVLQFRKFLMEHKIDVLHSWDYKSNYLEPLASRLSGVRYIYTKKNNAWSKRWFLKSFLSSHIAYDNPVMADRFFKSPRLSRKITFIPHGVNTDLFTRSKKRIEEKNLIIVCAGNINENKNQILLLKALLKLRQEVKLDLYGKEDAEYRKKMDSFISAHNLEDRVAFKGYLENMKLPEALQESDLFILPSFNEGFPVSLLEAMACGIPVLCSDSGGGSRYILEDRYIFQPDNVAELVEKINMI